MARLELLAGRAQPAAVTLEGEVVIGRSREVALQILDETASRRHASVRVEGGRTVLVDLGSANGTRLNGQRVERPAALFDGDVIEIGSVRLRFVGAEGADRDTAVPTPGGERVEEAVDPERADPAREGAGDEAQRRLRLVCDAAAACADAADADEVPATLLSLLVETFKPDRATVALRGPGGKLAVVAAHPTGASLPGSQTLATRVLERGEAVRIRDAHAEEPRSAGASLVAGRHRSTLAAPLKTAEGVLGLVVVEAVNPDRYGEADLRALAAVARQAALALRNLRVLSTARAEAQRASAARGGAAPELLGSDPAVAAVREQIARAARADATVLITGETGTGKELVARRLHAEGPRASRPFLALNCAALVEGLLESELFGHEKGAFTGAHERREGRLAQAADGTLFLDEVAELTPGLQAKLLRVLSERTFTRVGGQEPLDVRCRLVSATNRDLTREIAAGRFREDLYYRLAVLTITVPPLRERRADVVPLAEAHLERLAAALGRRVPRLSEDAREALTAWRWPGNVRELVNVLERALVLGSGDVLAAADLPRELLDAGTDAPRVPGAPEPPAAGDVGEVLTLREAEKRAVRAALAATGGRKGAAALRLGISWPTLNRKIREYGLDGGAGD
jgi:DNA-binding NtrC family response regulator